MKIKIWQSILLTTIINLLYVYLAFTYNLAGVFNFPILIFSAILVYTGGINSIKGIDWKTRLKLIGLTFFFLIILFISLSLPNMSYFLKIISLIIYGLTCGGLVYYFYKKCVEIIGG